MVTTEKKGGRSSGEKAGGGGGGVDDGIRYKGAGDGSGDEDYDSSMDCPLSSMLVPVTPTPSSYTSCPSSSAHHAGSSSSHMNAPRIPMYGMGTSWAGLERTVHESNLDTKCQSRQQQQQQQQTQPPEQHDAEEGGQVAIVASNKIHEGNDSYRSSQSYSRSLSDKVILGRWGGAGVLKEDQVQAPSQTDMPLKCDNDTDTTTSTATPLFVFGWSVDQAQQAKWRQQYPELFEERVTSILYDAAESSAAKATAMASEATHTDTRNTGSDSDADIQYRHFPQEQEQLQLQLQLHTEKEDGEEEKQGHTSSAPPVRQAVLARTPSRGALRHGGSAPVTIGGMMATPARLIGAAATSIDVIATGMLVLSDSTNLHVS
jgi:hypothetical protein